MDASVLVAIISGVGAIITALVGFLGNRKGTLATAEKDFRDAILNENKQLRARVDELEDELMLANRRLLKLEAIIIKAGLVIEDEEPERERSPEET